MNEERTGGCLRQVEHICGHLYVETFKTDVIVFISNKWSHTDQYFPVAESVDTDNITQLDQRKNVLQITLNRIVIANSVVTNFIVFRSSIHLGDMQML